MSFRRSARQTRILCFDLGGVAHRPTGVCLLKGRKAETCLLYTDTELLDYARQNTPALVAIDAPLTLPPGRRSINDRNGKHLRPCDEELRRRRIPFFPITLGPMRGLTERGMRLKKKLLKMGVRTVEIYPGGAQDVWRIPRAKRNLRGLRTGLERLGVLGLHSDASDHELDAATGALVALHFLMGKAEAYGDFKTGAIIMPRSLVGPGSPKPRGSAPKTLPQARR